MGPSHLLEFFKRGEVARDVRLAAAQGTLAPRAHEQLSILVLLLSDADPEIRQTAEQTIGRIQPDVLSRFLARSDVPLALLEFFGDRGIFPADAPADEADDPLIDTESSDGAPLEEVGATRDTITQQIAKMSFSDRLKAAIKGTREMRAILVRDPNKMISAAVMSSPKLTEQEVEAIARMATVSDEVLRMIGSNRAWMKNYSIVLGLTKNPKTPIPLSLNLMQRLTDRDVNQLSIDRNIPETLRIAARRRVLASESKR